LEDGDNTGYILGRDLDIRFFGWPFLLVTWLVFGLGKLENRKISRNEGDEFDPE
jgi:hypothetical protein